MSTGPLSIDVYVAPMRPYTCPDQLGEGEVATWAPSSSTLISGPTEGILIDALRDRAEHDRGPGRPCRTSPIWTGCRRERKGTLLTVQKALPSAERRRVEGPAWTRKDGEASGRLVNRRPSLLEGTGQHRCESSCESLCGLARRPRPSAKHRTGRARSNWGPDTEKKSLGPLEIREESRGINWSGTPGSNRRPSPWQGEQTESPAVSAPHQPSPSEPNHSGSLAATEAPHHQRSPAVHNGCVPLVFQDGARPLDVAQAAVLLGCTKDAVRAACGRGELAHTTDHLNAFRIPCSAVAAAARLRARDGHLSDGNS